MLLIYQIGIRFYYLMIVLASPFSRRAAAWLAGRREQAPVLPPVTGPESRTLWMHVSSLGEFEQGRPVLEQWRARFPHDRILLSFFSPSGYNLRKNSPLADQVFYLPLDTKKNMDTLVSRIRPDQFILVKYDFWPNLLDALNRHHIPCVLISARFRREQYLFTRLGRVFLRQLRCFRWIFVQDEGSSDLLKKQGFENTVIAGDTRVDAVMKRELKTVRLEDGKPVRPGGEGERKVLIGGSTWMAEEVMLARLWKSEEFRNLGKQWRLVIAPHDISEGHLVKIEELFPGETIRLSRAGISIQEALEGQFIILVDSIGQLSSLYSLADLAFIGGGFGKGIHNILEPAAFGLPVLFGPHWTKFGEAASLIDLGAAFPVSDYENFVLRIKKLCFDSEFRAESGLLAVSYMKSQMGSSDLIIRYLSGKW